MSALPGHAEPDAGLVASYDFTEGAGSTLRDSGRNGLHGRIEEATWVQLDPRHHALRFDGEDDYVDLGTDPRFDIRGKLSLEAWIQPQRLPIGEGLILGRGAGSFAIVYSGSAYPARVYFILAKAAKKSRAKATATGWHHVVASYDGDRLRIYVDGALQGGVRVWKHGPAPSSSRMRMGGGVPGFASFNGLITAVRVYNRAMDRQEAFARYQESRGQFPVAAAPADSRKDPVIGTPKRLNNLVAELARLDGPDEVSAAHSEVTFTHPCDG